MSTVKNSIFSEKVLSFYKGEISFLTVSLFFGAFLLYVYSCSVENQAKPNPNENSQENTPQTDTTWHKANLTNYTSYPDPDSEECLYYNGCLWAGQFAFIDGQQSEDWVSTHNIAAVHSKDTEKYALKTLRLRQGYRQIDVVVYDMCSDSDCDGCCTENADANGIGFLIDIEKYTMQRFGSGSGIVEWKCLDCE